MTDLAELQKHYEEALAEFKENPNSENHEKRTKTEQTLADAVRDSRVGKPAGIIAEEN